jgi:hypothetical protein
MNLCMAATYDPDQTAPNGFRLPFDLDRQNLRSLRGIYLDCGSRDQYRIHYGVRILSKRLQSAGIRHRYEEFDDTHSDVDYRMEVSLPFLTRALR